MFSHLHNKALGLFYPSPKRACGRNLFVSNVEEMLLVLFPGWLSSARTCCDITSSAQSVQGVSYLVSTTAVVLLLLLLFLLSSLY